MTTVTITVDPLEHGRILAALEGWAEEWEADGSPDEATETRALHDKVEAAAFAGMRIVHDPDTDKLWPWELRDSYGCGISRHKREVDAFYDRSRRLGRAS